MTGHIEAHKFSSNHMDKLKNASVCGCFYCGIDSVIVESSGFPITNEFLKKMNRYWFG